MLPRSGYDSEERSDAVPAEDSLSFLDSGALSASLACSDYVSGVVSLRDIRRN